MCSHRVPRRLVDVVEIEQFGGEGGAQHLGVDSLVEIVVGVDRVERGQLGPQFGSARAGGVDRRVVELVVVAVVAEQGGLDGMRGQPAVEGLGREDREG